MQVQIDSSWGEMLQDEFEKTYFKKLVKKVKNEYSHFEIFPEPRSIFRAFNLVPFDRVKVVILGQDPYHTPGVADGLAFSSKFGNKVPPSLGNIYKEIIDEFNYESYEDKNNPDLTRWATQGVFLLNNSLTVKSGIANSHSQIGWNIFTDAVIRALASNRNNLVFMLWGNFAKSKKEIILTNSGSNPHLILESAHPSPFSANNGFFGNNHFKKCNEFLKLHHETEIQW